MFSGHVAVEATLLGGSEVPDIANIKSNAARTNGLFKPEKRIRSGQRLRKFFCIVSLLCEVAGRIDKVEGNSGTIRPGQRGCQYGEVSADIKADTKTKKMAPHPGNLRNFLTC